MMVTEVLTAKIMFEDRLEGSDGLSLVAIWRKSIPNTKTI